MDVPAARPRGAARRRLRRVRRASVPRASRRPRTTGSPAALPPSRSGCGSLEERDRALAALKELEFDHRTGKISDADYRELVGSAPPAGRRGVARPSIRRGAGSSAASGRTSVPDCPHCGHLGPGRAAVLPGVRPAADGRSGATAIRPPARHWPPHPVLVIAVAGLDRVDRPARRRRLGVGAGRAPRSGVLFLTQREAERRAAKYALLGFRERFFADARDPVAARSRGQLELFRARRERAELEAERSRGAPQARTRGVLRRQSGNEVCEGGRRRQSSTRSPQKEAEIETLIDRPTNASSARRPASSPPRRSRRSSRRSRRGSPSPGRRPTRASRRRRPAVPEPSPDQPRARAGASPDAAVEGARADPQAGRQAKKS